MGTLEVRVPPQAEGERLDAWISSQAGACTRSQVKKAAEQGKLLVDGAPARVSLRLRGGETVRLDLPDYEADPSIEPEPIELDVLYEDEHMVAINKPVGMVVHPAVGNRSGTLVHALLHRYGAGGLAGESARAGIVHRLDRDTSGLIVVARTLAAHEGLSRQFRDRTLSKRYLALVRGRVKEAGTIDEPVGRHERDRKRMSTRARVARSAVTDYRPLEDYGRATLLLCAPKTGRTHQIRVHLASRGWPIVADAVYGGVPRRPAAGSAPERAVEGILAEMRRQALHAWQLDLHHPVHGRALTLEAPLAEDFAEVVARLRALDEGTVSC
jgi:23S rRNA pseudouridine1911/1915/1917 synthase